MSTRVGIKIQVDGEELELDPGTTIASAILDRPELGAMSWRPLCGMGICWGCRAWIDGRLHQRSCLVEAESGMEVVTDDSRL